MTLINFPNPLIKLRKKAEDQVNMHHYNLNTHQEVEHIHKRMEAMLVSAGGTPSAEFAEEAELMGKSPLELAQIIQSKPNETLLRGHIRRKAILAIRAETDPDKIDAIVESHRQSILKVKEA